MIVLVVDRKIFLELFIANKGIMIKFQKNSKMAEHPKNGVRKVIFLTGVNFNNYQKSVNFRSFTKYISYHDRINRSDPEKKGWV